ncbi:putative inner membrane protein [Chlamydia trachomatis]|nr:putative inner membrane protein [Chlamydia trachomatis]
MQASVQRALYDAFPAHQMELTTAFDLVESYLAEIQSSVLIIVGLIVLIYTVFSMILTVESVFNQIWQIKVSRSISKSLIGYFAAIVIVPISLIAISFSNIFISSLSSIELLGSISIAPIVTTLMKVLPFVVIILILTALYMLLPNTRVKFLPAFTSAVLAGAAFQLFQMVYISGQLWVSKYNSIYGSIAAIPLLMLFMQFSWTIILFGAQLSYAIQNVKQYVFRSESERISRRFRDLVALIMMKKVCKAFRHEGSSYSADLLATETDLPIVIVQDTLDKLVACRLLVAIESTKSSKPITYAPASEISSITIKRVLTAMDRLGSENFRMDIYDEYAQEWEAIRLARQLPFDELELPVVDIDNSKALGEMK